MEKSQNIMRLIADSVIETGYNKNVRRLRTTPSKYQNTRKRQNNPDNVLDVAMIAIPNLENIERREIHWDQLYLLFNYKTFTADVFVDILWYIKIHGP